MKTRLLSAFLAVVAMSFPAMDAQTPKPVDATPAPRAPQIEIRSQFFTVSASAAERLGLIRSPGDEGAARLSKLSTADFEKRIRTLVAEKSLKMLSAPGVTTKSGQRAVVEVIREFRYPTQLGEGNDGRLTPTAFETRNVGIAVEVEPTLSEGELIDLQVTPSLTGFRGFVNYTGGKTDNPGPIIPKDGFSQPIFDTARYLVSTTLRSEQTLTLGGFQWTGSDKLLTDPERLSLEAKPEADPKGEPQLMFVTLTARLIKKIAADEIKAGGPVEIRAQLVDLTRDQIAKIAWLKDVAAPAGRGTMICGVFDPKQAEVVRREVEKTSDGSLSSGPAKTIASKERYAVDATAVIRFPEKKKDGASLETERLNLQLDVEVNAQVENVIDLNIASIFTTSAAADADAATGAKAGISSAEWKWRQGPPKAKDGLSTTSLSTTSVSVFSGSTAVLVRTTEEHPDHLQVLLITAKGTPAAAGAPAPELQKPAAQAAGADAQKLPSAIPVPGKPGFVISPYAPGKGLIDVRGFPPGTEVKCPYTGSIFVIP